MQKLSIIKILQATVDLLVLHGENPVSIKNYRDAISKLKWLKPEEDVSKVNFSKISKEMAGYIAEIQATGSLGLYKTLLDQTPPGLLSILRLNGIGAKTAHILWKQLGIVDLPTLGSACEANSLAQVKGFGEKNKLASEKAWHFMLPSKGNITMLRSYHMLIT